MATGIVSIAADEHGLAVLSAVLGALAVAGLLGIAALVLGRVAAGVAPVAGDLVEPGTVLPLFGAVAACAVLGARYLAERSAVDVLGALGVAVWVALIPVAVHALQARGVPQLRARARGAWLLPTVATAGLVITAADLTRRSEVPVVAAAVGEVISLGLYVAAIGLIGARAVAVEPAADDATSEHAIRELLAGDSWIVMGGLAICTLAGDRILRAAQAAGATGWLDPEVRPVTVACWWIATALVPVLVVVHAWRLFGWSSWRGRNALPGGRGRNALPAGHGRLGARGSSGSSRAPDRTVSERRVPQHNVFWWAAVFPLGMYSVATRATADRFGWSVLPTLSAVFCWTALGAWTFAAAGLASAALRQVRAR